MNVRVTLKVTGSLNILPPAKRRQIMARVGREVVSIAQGTFGESGENRPEPWPPLSPRYQKRIRYFGPPKLILTGALKASIRIGTVEESSVTVIAGEGNSEDYASAHQFGASPIPARPFLPIRYAGIGNGYQLTQVAEQRVQQAITDELNRLTSDS